MKPEQITQGRERLAKWMGWTKQKAKSINHLVWAIEKEGEYREVCLYDSWRPDQDLNQIHEAEKNLTDDEWKKYIKILWSGSFDKFSESTDALYLMIKETMSATAIQRFEALINTIGE